MFKRLYTKTLEDNYLEVQERYLSANKNNDHPCQRLMPCCT